MPGLAPAGFHVLGGLTWVNQGELGRSPFAGEKANVMPRIGLACQITSGTILRAGYGLFYDSIGVNKTVAIQTGFSRSTPIQASLDSGLTYVATTANLFPNGLLEPLGPSAGLTMNLGRESTSTIGTGSTRTRNVGPSAFSNYCPRSSWPRFPTSATGERAWASAAT